MAEEKNVEVEQTQGAAGKKEIIKIKNIKQQKFLKRRLQKSTK